MNQGRLQPRAKALSLLVALLIWPILGSAQSPEQTWRTRCPAAAAWMDKHEDHLVPAMKARDATRQLTKPMLQEELQRRVDEDQEARRAWNPQTPDADAADGVRRVDADNLRWLKRQLVRRGLPTVSEVGEYGVHLIWLLIHHADDSPDLQRIALGMFKGRLDAGEFDAADFARLSDRVALKQGRAQPYGTQYPWANGGLSVQSVPNLEEIAVNRGALGLMSLEDYGCMMHAIRGLSTDRPPSDSEGRIQAQ